MENHLQKSTIYDFMHQTYKLLPHSYILARKRGDDLEILGFTNKWDEFAVIIKSYIKPSTIITEYREKGVAYLCINEKF